jgi:hypothetical protein
MNKERENKIIKRIDELISKAELVLSTEETTRFGKRLDNKLFVEWKTGALNLISNLLGKEHVYFQSFLEVKYSEPRDVRNGLGVLNALREDYEQGFLTEMNTLIMGEVFTDFLDMAEHLLENNYKDPAASLIGAVLEDGLKKIADNNGIGYKKRGGIAGLNDKLKEAGVYNPLVHKKVDVWREIRNKADHAEFGEYDKNDVEEMLKGVLNFLSENLK